MFYERQHRVCCCEGMSALFTILSNSVFPDEGWSFGVELVTFHACDLEIPEHSNRFEHGRTWEKRTDIDKASTHGWIDRSSKYRLEDGTYTQRKRQVRHALFQGAKNHRDNHRHVKVYDAFSRRRGISSRTSERVCNTNCSR
jgi:hypothetical protein